jgi:hypothetical protein
MNASVKRGLATGAALAAATTGTMMIASAVERGSPWAGINAMAGVVGLGGRRPRDRFDRAATSAGLGILVGGLVGWGLLYEGALTVAHRRSTLATGALSGLLAFAVDRLALPGQIVPRFRSTLGPMGTIAKYASLALVSAGAGRLRRRAEAVSAAIEGTNHVGEEAQHTSSGEDARRASLDEDVAAVQRPPADS